MGVPITRTKALTVAADDDGISTSQSPLAGGNLTITGALATAGVANLTSQRRVLFTFAADESARTFVVYGTNQSGASIQETVAGTTAGTTYTNLDFLTVTRISIDAASAGAIKVGTNGIGSGSWQSVNSFITPPNIGVQFVLTGTANWTLQGTNMDPNSLPSGVTYPPTFDHPTLTGLSANTQGTWNDAISFFRTTINSGTGSVQMTYVQSGLASA